MLQKEIKLRRAEKEKTTMITERKNIPGRDSSKCKGPEVDRVYRT